jgi:hypothetical protein
MLIRISLIVAIIAGLAVGALNFVKVKEKISTLQTNLATETAAHQEFQTKFTQTKSALDKTNAVLKQTIANLDEATAAKDKAVADLAAQTKRADKLTEDLTKTRQERDDAQADLASYKATGLKPPEILAMNKQYKTLQDALAGTQEENKVLGQDIKKLKNRLALYENPNEPVLLPAGLRGKVLVLDPKYNFVVLDVGEAQGLLERGELLVKRDGNLVAKVIVTRVQKGQSIANVMPGWELGQILEGDQVIPAHPAS